MEQPLEKGETVPTPMGKPRELPLGGFHGSVTNAARTALNPAPATPRPKQRKRSRTNPKRRRSGIRRQAGEATAAESGRACRDRKGDKANEGPRATHCYARRESRESRKRGLPGPLRRRRTRIPTCRCVRNSLAAIRIFDAQGFGGGDRGPSLSLDLNPGSPDQVAFNAALAVIDGVRPKDEIEAMLAGHMAVANILLLELVARTRAAVAGHRYEGNGIKRLDVLGNLTTKFMRTYTMQVEVLARKRRKGEQNIRVEHVHVHAGGQAIVGNVSHRGRGLTKNDQQPYEDGHEKPTAPPVSDGTSVRSEDQEWRALRVASNEKGTLSIARRRTR